MEAVFLIAPARMGHTPTRLHLNVNRAYQDAHRVELTQFVLDVHLTTI
jgi:hypothetical protein